VTWFKVDDQFPRHPKVVRAGTDAAWLFIAGGCYCSQYLTDGFIPKDALVGLTALRTPLKLAQRLVEAGLWHDRGDCWEVNDFLQYNPSREQVENDRRAARERRSKGGRTSGERRANVMNPDPTRPVVPTEQVKKRKQRPVENFEPNDRHRAFALEKGLSLEEERVGWLDWCAANGRLYDDVDRGFSTWLRQAVTFGRGGKPVASFEQMTGRDERKTCAQCANTGHYFDKHGEFVECSHGRVA
jgi:hypothetical protein